MIAGAIAWSLVTPQASPPSARLAAPPSANVFLTPSGSDGNPCSQALPCATFSRAYQAAKPGNVVCVGAGSYGAQTIPFVGGRTTPNVVFQGCGGTATVLAVTVGANTGGPQPCCVSFKDLTITGSSSTRAVFVFWGGTQTSSSAHDISFENDLIAVGQATSGPVFEAVDVQRLTVKNTTIGPACCGLDNNGNPAGSPIGIRLGTADRGYPQNTDVVIDHNLIQGITRNCSYWLLGYGACPQASCVDTNICHADAIQIWGADNTTISRNRIYNNEVQAVFFDPTAPVNGGTITNNMIGGLINSSNCGVCWSGTATGGTWRVAFNTLQGGAAIRIVNVASLRPQTTFTIKGNLGNIVTEAATTGSDCTSGSTGVFTYAYNVWNGAASSSRNCGPTDATGRPSFLDASPAPQATIDLHLARGSAALGQGAPTTEPAFDFDGDLRPLRTRSDAGADQRETALLVPGKSIGALAVGATRKTVEAFYGAPHRLTKWKPVGTGLPPRSGKAAPRIAFYRVHGGSLWAIYADDIVVGLGTTSRYYSTLAGLGVGATAEDLRGAKRLECRHAYRSYRGGVATFYGIPSAGKAGTIGSVSMLRRSYEYC